MNGQLNANNLTYSQGNLRLDLLRNQGNQTLQDQIQEAKPLTIDPTKLIPVQPLSSSQEQDSSTHSLKKDSQKLL